MWYRMLCELPFWYGSALAQRRHQMPTASSVVHAFLLSGNACAGAMSLANCQYSCLRTLLWLKSGGGDDAAGATEFMAGKGDSLVFPLGVLLLLLLMGMAVDGDALVRELSCILVELLLPLVCALECTTNSIYCSFIKIYPTGIFKQLEDDSRVYCKRYGTGYCFAYIAFMRAAECSQLNVVYSDHVVVPQVISA